MNKLSQNPPYFTVFEQIAWSTSVLIIVSVSLILPGTSAASVIASLIGVSSLVLNAKGNPIGQLLMVIFSLLYGYISFALAYYGEMITYLGMTAPMAVVALVSWLRHPYRGSSRQVEVNSLSGIELLYVLLLTLSVTAVFYFILRYFHTACLPLATLSVATSFAAVYLTFRRSAYYALAYALNDIVLIALWISASIENTGHLSVVVCFFAFLFFDLYGFFSWRRMHRDQSDPAVP